MSVDKHSFKPGGWLTTRGTPTIALMPVAEALLSDAYSLYGLSSSER